MGGQSYQRGLVRFRGEGFEEGGGGGEGGSYQGKSCRIDSALRIQLCCGGSGQLLVLGLTILRMMLLLMPLLPPMRLLRRLRVRRTDAPDRRELRRRLRLGLRRSAGQVSHGGVLGDGSQSDDVGPSSSSSRRTRTRTRGAAARRARRGGLRSLKLLVLLLLQLRRGKAGGGHIVRIGGGGAAMMVRLLLRGSRLGVLGPHDDGRMRFGLERPLFRRSALSAFCFRVRSWSN
mmetsp:Transcript_21862/g.40783  ORF Transcript_21862/g.40783 Transcript_21862/m.40783 type:complete len:232 (-) Transcript_21862:293-988(-)